MRQILLQNATFTLLQNATEVYYKKCGAIYHKMPQFYYKMWRFYCKMQQVLQNAMFTTNCDNTDNNNDYEQTDLINIITLCMFNVFSKW